MSKLSAQISLFNNVAFLDKLLFTKHLYIMIKSGIPIPEAVNILIEETSNLYFKKKLLELEKDLSNGQSLYDSLSKTNIFNSFYLNIVKIGEESGNLEKNLDYLSKEMEKEYEFKKKVSGALLYPIFVIVASIIIAAGISIFVLPQFVNLFSSMDVELPLTTKILIFISETMRDYGLIIVPGFFVLVLITSLIVKTKLVKPHWQAFLLNLPVFGKFIRNSETASFCRSIGIMIKSGIPISKSLLVVSDSTSNLIFKNYLLKINTAVEKGNTIESEISNGNYKYLPIIVSKMIGVGEKTGSLDETFLYLADFFEEEVDNTAKNLPVILEPILLVVVALIVLFLALAIISPIYELTGSVRK